MANQCCSYNDGGNCTDDCGMNREGNSNFTCVCSNFWIGADCDGMTVCTYVVIDELYIQHILLIILLSIDAVGSERCCIKNQATVYNVA